MPPRPRRTPCPTPFSPPFSRRAGANEKLCFAGAGASSLQRYVQTIARISQDKSGTYWFNALCREFDEPFAPVKLR